MTESRYEFVGHEEDLARYEWRSVEPEVMYDIPKEWLERMAREAAEKK